MVRRLLAALALAAPLIAAAQLTQMPARIAHGAPTAPAGWRAPSLAPVDVASMPALLEKEATTTAALPGQPLRIGTVQALEKSASVTQWTRVSDGYVAKVRVSSEGALGIRTRIDLGTVPGDFSIVVQGSESRRLEPMTIDPTLGNTHWTPWTEGSAQVIEIFSRVLPSPGAVNVAAVLHFTDSPIVPKAGASSCTVPASCTTGNATLDNAIAQATKSNVKITFVKNGGGFLCTATLINSTLGAPFLLTANHCISSSDVAGTVGTYWFFETVSCSDLSIAPTFQQGFGGTTLVFTNFNVDSTLLQMNQSPPNGAVYSAWNTTILNNGASVVSVSHPMGDASRVALGMVAGLDRYESWPYDMYDITYSSGIIEGGSSGSGLFTLNSSGALELRGVLTGSSTDAAGNALSCGNLNEFGIYDRFEVFGPEIAQYLAGAPRTDDAPNRYQDIVNTPISDPNGVDMPIDQRTTPLVFSNYKIDYAGDIDIFRFRLTSPATVRTWTTGTTDTVGTLMDSTGAEIDANDDESEASTNMGMTNSLQPGTYYVAVGNWVPQGTGTYSLNIASTNTQTGPTDYTDLWWGGSSESGWGINLNHQGNTLFATLYTYNASGAPLWLSSAAVQQGDGSFTGVLYSSSGPAFNSNPWVASAVQRTAVGAMTFIFSGASAGTLTYTYNGISVTKPIQRIVFGTPPTCTFTTGDRSSATNYQDLWWGGQSESGWGINLTHQGNTIFATLFDYDTSGALLWLSSADVQQTDGSFTGTLYRSTGPAFNSSPWDPNAVQRTSVGTMTFTFTSGNSGTLNYTVNGLQVVKAIQRLVFSSPTTQCQ